MVEKIWVRIIENEGQVFKQIRGKEFTFHVVGNGIKLSTTNQVVAKSVFAKAIELLPVINTVPFRHLRALSYIFAILTDKKIVE